MNCDKIGNKLKKIRLDNNLSQEEMAEKLFITRQAISRWETGKSLPDYATLLLISKEFKIKLDDLFNIDENINEEFVKTTIDNFNKMKKITKLKWIISLIIIVFIVLFSIIFTLINYNKHSIYEIKYVSNDIVCNQGLIFTNPKNVYFIPCKVEVFDEEIDVLTYYYYDKSNNKRLIISGGESIMYFNWKDSRNISELFDYKLINIDNKLPEIYVDIETINNSYTIKLDVNKVY